MRIASILLLITLAVALHAAEIAFPESATVYGQEMLLGEIATVTGAEDDCARLRAVVLGASPALGQQRVLTLPMISVRLRQFGFKPESLTIACPATVTVTRYSTSIAGETLTAVAEDWLRGRLKTAPGDELTFTPSRTPVALTLPDGEVKWQCDSVGGEAGCLRSVMVTVTVNGKSAWRGVISFTLTRFATVVVAAGVISRGTAFCDARLVVEKRDISSLAGEPIRDIAELAGNRAAAALRAGEVLTTRVVEATPLIKKNDLVFVRSHCGALVVSAQVIACEDGAKGSLIRVRNPATRQEFSARVIASGELELTI